MTERISENLSDNRKYLEERFSNCGDIILRPMELGISPQAKALLVYVEGTVSNGMLEESAVGKLVNRLWQMSSEGIMEYLDKNGPGIPDMEVFPLFSGAVDAMLAGNVLLFLDGCDHAWKIGGEGYPGLGVSRAENEKLVRGSREAFGESVVLNTSLIRKRIRSTGLKAEPIVLGVRSHTGVSILYMEDLVHTELLRQVKEELTGFLIDAIPDTGILEQLMGNFSWSPFPKFQVTERPDKAAMALLDGRIVLTAENSPSALILPATLHSLMQTGDDYFENYQIVSLVRCVRYLGLILAFSLPGLYLALTGFHPQLLPASLALSLAEARSGVPFSGAAEVLFLELSFELLREAGLRMPGAMGNIFGIVGGLIIGQAAVSAKLLSPVVVIVTALTALGSFSIPNEELSEAFRLLKYGMILLCAFLGIYGYLFGWIFLLTHLAGLESFGVPYLMPFASWTVDGIPPWKDGILRAPLRHLDLRPVFTRQGRRRKYRRLRKYSDETRLYQDT